MAEGGGARDEKPALREIPKEELDKILAEHQRWVESEGQDGREGERANLFNAIFVRVPAPGVN